jgi:acyl-CoA thioesterase YciA
MSDFSEDASPSIRVMMMPRDTNGAGTIFGGVILSYIDQAGSVEAGKHAARTFVTVAVKEVEFLEPVYVGDIISLYTKTVRVGRTSVTVQVDVYAHHYTAPDSGSVKVTSAELTYVAVDDRRRPVPIK